MLAGVSDRRRKYNKAQNSTVISASTATGTNQPDMTLTLALHGVPSCG